MADPVARLMRLRTAQADTARRDLAAALRANDEAEAHIAASRAALHREAGAAPADAAHPLIAAFAAWLPAGQAEIRRIAAEQMLAEAALVSARNILSEARVAMRACESLADSLTASRRKDAQQRAQTTLEDVARRRASIP
jgi:hypothetical protein